MASATFDSINLPDAFADIFSTNSKIVSDSTNNVISSLENQFNNELLPAILSNAQDKKVVRGQMIGELGVAAEDSTRNLSAIQDADATFDQNILAATNTFVSQVTEAALQNQSSQNELVSQAANMQSQLDSQKTELFGVLFENGVNTGQMTQQGLANELNYDNSLFEASRLRSLRPGQSTFEATNLTRSLENIQINNSAMSDIQLQGAQLQLQNNRNLVNQVTDIRSSYRRAFENPTDPSSVAWIESQKSQYGSAIHTYYSLQTDIEQDANGNMTLTENIIIDPDALSRHGVLMNLGFESTNYNSLVADMSESERPDVNFTNQVLNAINSGEASDVFNKVLLESNDGAKMLIAMRNTNESGTGFVYREIDTSSMSQSDKLSMDSELANIDQREAGFFSQMNDVLSRYSAKGLAGYDQNLDISTSGSEFSSLMDRLNSDDYSEVANMRITSGLPENKFLFPLIAAGTGGRNVMTALRGYVKADEINQSTLESTMNDLILESRNMGKVFEYLGYEGNNAEILQNLDKELAQAILDGNVAKIARKTNRSKSEIEGLNLSFNKMNAFRNDISEIVAQTTEGGDANRSQVMNSIASILSGNRDMEKLLINLLNA